MPKQLQINLGRIARRPSCNDERIAVILGLTKVHPPLLTTCNLIDRYIHVSNTWELLHLKLETFYGEYNIPDEPPEPNLRITPQFDESYAFYALITEYVQEEIST